MPCMRKASSFHALHCIHCDTLILPSRVCHSLEEGKPLIRYYPHRQLVLKVGVEQRVLHAHAGCNDAWGDDVIVSGQVVVQLPCLPSDYCVTDCQSQSHG
eukprot:990900-Rhodomonas_salina.1